MTRRVWLFLRRDPARRPARVPQLQLSYERWRTSGRKPAFDEVLDMLQRANFIRVTGELVEYAHVDNADDVARFADALLAVMHASPGTLTLSGFKRTYFTFLEDHWLPSTRGTPRDVCPPELHRVKASLVGAGKIAVRGNIISVLVITRSSAYAAELASFGMAPAAAAAAAAEAVATAAAAAGGGVGSSGSGGGGGSGSSSAVASTPQSAGGGGAAAGNNGSGKPPTAWATDVVTSVAVAGGAGGGDGEQSAAAAAAAAVSAAAADHVGVHLGSLGRQATQFLNDDTDVVRAVRQLSAEAEKRRRRPPSITDEGYLLLSMAARADRGRVAVLALVSAQDAMAPLVIDVRSLGTAAVVQLRALFAAHHITKVCADARKLGRVLALPPLRETGVVSLM
eukprot:CAMPEP_0198343360 /NCGR_PEP_ID=MMETSP1450-20131203/59599_1 /TAXON_ID=753684 ORGANISM="Madagascaria erythrocladiodes, Strain CCMP3234" /NCGR_SAMPLE_ID=MMETSP1450 /ASSEMBLY_ACC=CAM_ASM_001115 /LENGTH=395 /DNA_ID=CAMNT_0044048521 /DNA_START=9 /DNA_END=1193 /DNA_ORIENTATION=-